MTSDSTQDIIAGKAPEIELVLITGLSGAGRTTAIHALEDIGLKQLTICPSACYRPSSQTDPSREKLPLA